MLDAYQEELRRILHVVIGLDDDRHGYSEPEVAEAEARLGVGLPPPLRSMYRYAGRHLLWRRSQHPLVEPSALEISDGALVFLEEEQAVVEYLLLSEDLGEEDPPVFQRPPDEPGERYREDRPLSQFLLESMCWQLIGIGEELNDDEGVVLEALYGQEMSHEAAKEEVAGMTRVGPGTDVSAWTDGAYYAEKAVAYVFVGDEETSVYSWRVTDEE